jgi:GTP cyclohydrolase I
MKDIQKEKDTRGVAIQRVGVSDIKIPIKVKEKLGLVQTTIATISLAVSLPADVKGTHMSRFTEVLNEYLSNNVLEVDNLQKLSTGLLNRLDSESVFVSLRFPFFINQNGPESGKMGIAPVDAGFDLYVSPNNITADRPKLSMFCAVDGKTCCPCSKTISDFDPITGRGQGAHAQRSKITMLVETNRLESVLWFEDLITMAMLSFSSPVYPVLKRVDERHVTMAAYNNPKFVEDVIRDIVVSLRADNRVVAYDVIVVNQESIHYHNAYAQIKETK